MSRNVKMNAKKLHANIIRNQYCIGCGACAAVEDSDFEMTFTEDGRFEAKLKDSTVAPSSRDYARVCPFATTYNEDKIGADHFSGISGIEHNPYEGYVLARYAGHAHGSYRDNGSSGGLTTWLLDKLLSEGIVDSIVHVTSRLDEDGKLYGYAISNDSKTLADGSSSRYYPVQMADVLKEVKERSLSCAIVGIPCFIKAINLLQREDEVFNDLVKMKVGIVCGHLKSEYFARSYAMELGIPYEKVTAINFREKLAGRRSSDYGVKLTYQTGDGERDLIVPTRELSTTNWGLGYFKYRACEYCDDVLAETADVSFGDAWLPQYTEDSRGTNVVVIRTSQILRIFNEYRDEIHLEDLTAKDVYQSQAGGFRHRRQGLQYRLYLNKDNDAYVPVKRVVASDALPGKRKAIYAYREVLRTQSFSSFSKAEEAGDFQVFKDEMDPYVEKYLKMNQKSIFYRIARKVYQLIKRIFSRV